MSDCVRLTGCQAHIDLSRKAATAGMVLLKNNGTLPLKKGAKVALFGQASIAYVKGGSGSGDVHCAYVHNLYDGMEQKEAEGKISLFAPLKTFYADHIEKDRKRVEEEKAVKKEEFDKHDHGDWMARTIIYQEMTRDIYISEPEVPQTLLQEAAAFADTAIISFNRYSGEGWDRVDRKGDYYLTDGEAALVEQVSCAFSHTVVILNVGGVVDTSLFYDNDRVDSLLLSWQAGMEGGTATADILCGDANPSGKLATTFARDYADYPSSAHLADDDLYVNYYEDIYVGYRYFSTIPGASSRVLYPFGFGLSYTTFAFTDALCEEKDGSIRCSVTVTNTGMCAGREVVQLYYAAPQGLLGKPALALAAFEKTKYLTPGESQVITLSFPVNNMASFDDLGKIQKAAYVLEKGDYRFHIGNSVRDANVLDFVYRVSEDTVVEQLSQRCVPCKLEKRLRSDGSYEPLPLGEAKQTFRVHPAITEKAPADAVSYQKLGKDISMNAFIAQFTDKELCEFMSGDPAFGICNTACFSGMERLNVPKVPTADGPAGLRIQPQWKVYTTAFPCACLLACTWDPQLVEEIGKAGGAEVKENGLNVWLTPALNIHRTPLCGRNFEYFSEDPLISGKMAAAKVRGIQSVGVAASVKHFACNNRELYRRLSDSRVSQRALREIYLKGFEICVRESDPWTVMSSYNLINGIHTAESSDLLEGILRDEWGFNGFVTTDWGIKNDPVAEVKAGNDMKMPSGYPDELLEALEKGELTRGDLEACARRILAVYQKMGV